MNSNLENERGFVLVYGIMLISLFLVALLTLSLVQKKVLLEKQTLNFCLKYQKKTFQLVLKPIKQLFSLNPQARLLRSKLRLAQRKLALALAARNPVLTAKYYLEISGIKARQTKLHVQQQMYFRHAEIIFQERNNNWEYQFRSYFSKLTSTAKPVFILKTEKFKFTKTELQIKPESFSETAPAYVVNPDFSQKQILQTNWSFSLAAENRKYESTLNSFGRINWEQRCGITLTTKAENQWDIKTAVGKSWSNF